MRRKWTMLVAALAVTVAAFAQKNDSPEVMLGAGLHQEDVESNCKEAIKIYDKVVQHKNAARNIAARAQLHIGSCQEKLGQREARAAYEAVLSRYGDQTDAVAEARSRLTALDGARSSGALTARLVWSDPAIDGGASLSQDGRLLAMIDWSTGDLAMRDMSTGQVKRLMAKAGSFNDSPKFAQTAVLSPDLRQVVYAWFDPPASELRVMPNEAGGKQRALISNPEFTYFIPAAWSLDGKSILVTIWKQDKTGQLAWVSAGDGAVKMLKSMEWRLPPYVESRPSLSPDGRYIAYSALERQDLSESSIFLIAADGSRETELVKNGGINEAPIWTPDGKHVVYTSNRSGAFGLWSIPVQDGRAAGAPVRVKSDIGRTPAMGFTRSGSYYYRNVGPAEEGTFLADLDPATGFPRGRAARLESSFGSVSPAQAWSPDGKSIALAKPNEFVVLNIETGETTAIKPPAPLAGSVMWFSDGKTLLQAVRDAQSRIYFYRVDLKTKEFKQVVATGATSNSLESALSPDEKTVYTNAGEGFKKGNGSQTITAFDLTTGQKRQVFIAKEDGLVPGIALSSDGRTLVFKLFYPGKRNEQHLCVVGVDGSNFRELYAEIEPENGTLRPQLAWTRDGRTILFTRATNEGWQLMRISAEGGKPEFTGLRGKGTPGIDLSRDGSRIAYNDVVSGSNAELWALDNLMSVLKADR